MENHTQPGTKETYGVYRAPKQFIHRAMQVQHPFDQRFAVEDITRQNLFNLLTKGKSWVAKQRLEFARKLAGLARELASDEARFHLSLPAHAQEVLKEKGFFSSRNC